MSNEIKYSFNVGDKLRVVQGGLFLANILKDATGIITDEFNDKCNGMMDITNGFNLKIIEPKSFKGQIWRLSYYGEYELLETTNFKGCERLQYRDTKKYKTIVKNGFIEFQKSDDYIEFENGSKIIGIDIAKGKDKTTRGKRADVFITLDEDYIFKFNKNKLICIKECIYPKGSKVEIIRKVNNFIIVTDGKNINPFRESEFEECFTEYVDVNKISFKIVNTKQIKVMKEV